MAHATVQTCPEDIAVQCVLDTFDALPTKFKPRSYPNGIREWTTLSGIVLSEHGHGHTCVSLGTGVKCLPASKLPLAHGNCLHDWHAEIVALRAFNHYLLQECQRMSENSSVISQWISHKDSEDGHISSGPPFVIKDSVQILMYSSEAPCGDSSMELVMQLQENPEPWEYDASRSEMLPGRGHFSKLGMVRRKPARADAALSNSKSCSDKLAMKQCLSALNSFTSLMIHPGNAYIHSLILPASSCVPVALERCFGPKGRLAALKGRPCSDGYEFKPFHVHKTNLPFAFQKADDNGRKLVSSNIASVWTPNYSEVLIGGTKQGFKQFSSRGGSGICRRSIWRMCIDLARSLGNSELENALSQACYDDVKSTQRLRSGQVAKQYVKTTALAGWTKNGGDGDFCLA